MTMTPVPDLRISELAANWSAIRATQSLAEQYGIRDIFQDAGGKMLQLAIVTGVDLGEVRNGPDATDRMGNEYEIKTTDVSRTKGGFSTNHHLNHTTLRRYRRRRWIFALYDGIELSECYLIEPHQLETVFRSFEFSLGNKEHLNNPKIPLAFVRRHGRPFNLSALHAAA